MPIFLLFPLKKEIARFLQSGLKPYDSVIGHFEERGFRYIDLLEELKRRLTDHSAGQFFIGRHISVTSNDIIARSLADALSSYIDENGQVDKLNFLNSREPTIS